MTNDEINAALNHLADRSLDNSARWFPHAHRNKEALWVHLALGVGGEAGEAVDVVKKISRDGLFTDERMNNLRGETLDVLTYVLMLGRVQGIDWAEARKEMDIKCSERWDTPSERKRSPIRDWFNRARKSLFA